MKENRQHCLKLCRSGRIHMVGITGSSMSGLAVMLTDMGYQVTGSCDRHSDKADELTQKGIPVTVGEDPQLVHGASLVVYTTAVPQENREIEQSRKLGIPLIDRPALLSEIAEAYSQTVAISGTHGKTTTTSMLAQILVEGGLDPSVHIGGELDAIGGSVRLGESELFVTEACEYRKAFLRLQPKVAIVLNIDRDHLDCYRDIEEIEEAFGQFMDRLSVGGVIIGNGNDPRIRQLVSSREKDIRLFGWDPSCDYYPCRYTEDEQGYAAFDFCCRGQILCRAELRVPGRFNAENAFAALAAAHLLGADMHEAAKSLEHFRGAHRRFELTGNLNGTEFFHDYGHNPTEIRNAISIARKRCKGTLIAVLQPHTFSRVRLMFDEFAECTKEADVTLVTDIFLARETDPGDLNSGMLAAAMQEKGIHAILTPTFADAEVKIRELSRPGDLVITLGCGNINLLNERIMPISEHTKELDDGRIL